MKVLDPMSDFPAWGPDKGTGSPEGIWPWGPAGSDHRPSTGLGEAETPVLEERKKKVTQSFPTLCDPIDCSLPGSSVHGILQARILEWGAISFSRGSSWPGDWTRASRIVGRCFTIWATSLGGDTHNFAHTKTQRRGAGCPQKTEPNLPASVGGPPAEVWAGRADHRGPGPWKGSLGINPLGGRHWPDHRAADLRAGSPQTKQLPGRGMQPCPSAYNWMKASLSRPCPQSKTQFFPPPGPPSGSLPKPLSLLHQRADRGSKKHSPTAAETKATLQKLLTVKKAGSYVPDEETK